MYLDLLIPKIYKMILLGCPLQKPFLSGVYLTFLVAVLSRRWSELISHHFF